MIEDEHQLDYLIRLVKLLKYKSISTNSMLMLLMLLVNSALVYSEMDNTAWGAVLYLRHYCQHHAQIARNL